tara:strand:+ start:432 stop:953 length:522 start_codon:yes stop_codon:yes gene_type:complete
MTGQINVNKIAARTGNTITINSGDKLSGAAGSIVAPGQIIQVVSVVDNNTYVSTTSTSFVNYSHLDATITPKFATSKILVMLECSNEAYQNNSHDCQQRQVIYRDGSAISREAYFRSYDYGGSGSLQLAPCTITHLDSPNKTSSTLYQLYFKMVSGDSAAIYGGSMTLMEIAQ